jgi:1,2-phenylacetyl-CoA epoxidase PaaB subunit
MNAATSIAAAKSASITTASCNSRNEKTQMQLAKATKLYNTVRRMTTTITFDKNSQNMSLNDAKPSNQDVLQTMRSKTTDPRAGTEK